MDLKTYFQKARSEGFALGAFNAGNLEIASAIFQAARDTNTPVIIETSPNELAHFGLDNFLAVINNFRKKELQVWTNLDHGQSLEDCQKAIEAGFDMIHFDGSKLPIEENIKITQALSQAAHSKGVLVEAEIDHVPGESKPHEEGEEVSYSSFTDSQKAADFVQQTDCDILAVFIGNLHGTYEHEQRLDIERLSLLKENANCYFSLHGGSGLFPEDVKAAIKNGVVKVNINTELRTVYRSTLENVLKGSDEVAIYKIMPPVMAAVTDVVEEKIKLFSNPKDDIDIPAIKPSEDGDM